MHLSTFFCIALANNVLAIPANDLTRRAGGAIPNAIGMVKTSVDKLDTAVLSIKNGSDVTALGNVATQATAVGDTIKKAQKMIENAPALSLIGALDVQQSASGLTSSLMKTTTDLISKKPQIQQAGLSQVVGMMLVMQKNQSTGLVNAISQKVPALARPLAQGQSNQVNAALDMAIKAFSGPGAAATPGNSTTPRAPMLRRGLIRNWYGANERR
jgi:hypothetical protein